MLGIVLLIKQSTDAPCYTRDVFVYHGICGLGKLMLMVMLEADP